MIVDTQIDGPGTCTLYVILYVFTHYGRYRVSRTLGFNGCAPQALLLKSSGSGNSSLIDHSLAPTVLYPIGSDRTETACQSGYRRLLY